MESCLASTAMIGVWTGMEAIITLRSKVNMPNNILHHQLNEICRGFCRIAKCLVKLNALRIVDQYGFENGISGSLKPSILSLTSNQLDKYLLGVGRAAVEKLRCKANMVALWGTGNSDQG